jgi:hypothetical protein
VEPAALTALYYNFQDILNREYETKLTLFIQIVGHLTNLDEKIT